MTSTKRHLIRARGAFMRAACGLRDPRIYTDDPARVTCRACQRTLFMADVETNQRRKARRSARAEREEQP